MRDPWDDNADLHGQAEAERKRWVNGNGHHPEPFLEPLIVVDPTKWQGKPVPQRRWIVPWWVPWRRVTGLYGSGGEGKTLLMQQLLTASALHQRWIGLDVVPVKAFSLFCEDDEEELHERQDAINQLYGCSFADLGDIRMVPRLGFDNLLMVFDGRGRPELTPLWHQCLAEIRDFGAKLVIVDTVADTYGGNENDRTQARQFMQVALGGIARAIDGAVIALAHPSRSGAKSGSGESGSTQWEATFRSRLYLNRPEQQEGGCDPEASNLRTLTRKKANYAPRDETIELRWKHSVFVPTRETGIIGSIERKTCERVFLDLLDATTAEGQPVCANCRAGNYAPRLFEKRPAAERQHFKQADFERAMQALFSTCKIMNADYGRKGDERTRIVQAHA